MPSSNLLPLFSMGFLSLAALAAANGIAATTDGETSPVVLAAEARLAEARANFEAAAIDLETLKIEIETKKLQAQVAELSGEKEPPKSGELGQWDPIGRLFHERTRRQWGDHKSEKWKALEPMEPGDRSFVYEPIRRDEEGRIFSDKVVLSNLLQWDFEWAVAKLGTRVYFDTGHDDEGEIDLFKDGGINASIDMINFYLHRPFLGTELDWGPNTGIGVATGSDVEGSDAALLMLNYGLFLRPKDSNWQIDLGFMTGVSADESLDSMSRDDTAFYVGLSVGSLFDSAKQSITKKE